MRQKWILSNHYCYLYTTDHCKMCRQLNNEINQEPPQTFPSQFSHTDVYMGLFIFFLSVLYLKKLWCSVYNIKVAL